MIGRLMAQDKASQPVGDPLLASDPLTLLITQAVADLPWYGRY